MEELTDIEMIDELLKERKILNAEIEYYLMPEGLREQT